jgi:hypothetical protein
MCSKSRIFLIIFLFLIIVSIFKISIFENIIIAENKEHYLWKSAVEPYLNKELWVDKVNYDAGHFLMVPLHAAFLNGEETWQQQFADHFLRFIQEGQPISVGRLNKLHYLYLASRFLVLAKRYKHDELIPPQLIDLLFNEVKKVWEEEPAWQWDRKPFPGGIRERVLWKLNNKSVTKSYYRAIIDEELFVFAIAADLGTYYHLSSQEIPSTILDILEIIHSVFQQEVVSQPDGGWLFQPGVMTDHPDYAYAGHEEVVPEMKPLSVPGIAWDSSHSHRFPLWLISFIDYYPKQSTEYLFYKNLREGLEKQLFNKVLVLPTSDFPGYRMKNYMDGTNGIYRWNYASLGPNKGYKPYEISGTLTLGWWIFLETPRIQKVYQDLANSYPFPKEVLKLYMGPSTTFSFYDNGFRELISRLASKLPLEQ